VRKRETKRENGENIEKREKSFRNGGNRSGRN
jgi:hypothetical protein